MSKYSVLTSIKRKIYNHVMVAKRKKRYKAQELNRELTVKRGIRARKIEKRKYYNDFSRNPNAEFIPKIILDTIVKVVLQDTAIMHRATNKTMVTNIVGNDNMTKRIIHVFDAANIAKEIAEALGVNGDLAYVGALLHDLGHTFNGHLGERMMSNIAEDYGFGFLCHNALGVEVLLNKKISDRVKERLRDEAPDISEREIDEAILKVYDCILSHNGEGVESYLEPDLDKTEDAFWEDFRLCYIERKHDRKIVPMTLEAAIVKFSDLISYIPSDILDAFRSEKIRYFDDEYLEALKIFGITQEFLDNSSNPKVDVANIIRQKFIADIIDNSTQPWEDGMPRIGLSKEMAEAMYRLRRTTQQKFVMHSSKPIEVNILPDAVRSLNIIFANEILNRGMLKKFIHKTSKVDTSAVSYDQKQEEMIEEFREYVSKLDAKEREIIRNNTKRALNFAIDEEIALAIALINDNLTKEQNDLYDSIVDRGLSIKLSRIMRFKQDIEQIYGGNITEEQIKEYKDKILAEINLTKEESEALFRDRLRKENLDATDEEIARLFTEGYETSRLITYEELLAMNIAAQYISGASDGRIKNLIQIFGIVDKDVLDIADQPSDEKLANPSLTAVFEEQDREMQEQVLADIVPDSVGGLI